MKSPKMKETTRIEGRVYTHRIIWRVATDAAKRAAASSRNSHARLAACVFAAFAIEAYLNLLIECLDPEVYQKERAHFSKGRLAGVRGKLRWCERKLRF